jgi:hypothetical protein
MSRNDYPATAVYNARWAIIRNWHLRAAGKAKAGTRIGWARANQLHRGANLSDETIKRTYSYLSRARPIAGPGRNETRASIAYNLWGGDAMLRWTKKVLSK